jgi:hypothetical protein
MSDIHSRWHYLLEAVCRHALVMSETERIPVEALQKWFLVLATPNSLDPHYVLAAMRCYRILQLRFGLHDRLDTLGDVPMPYAQIAKHEGVSHATVKFHESRGLRMLRHPSRSRWLIPYLTNGEQLL